MQIEYINHIVHRLLTANYKKWLFSGMRLFFLMIKWGDSEFVSSIELTVLLSLLLTKWIMLGIFCNV